MSSYFYKGYHIGCIEFVAPGKPWTQRTEVWRIIDPYTTRRVADVGTLEEAKQQVDEIVNKGPKGRFTVIKGGKE